jgi:3-hydroxyisobutyrate dehydrogenase
MTGAGRRIGFIGTGRMGAPVAGHLLDAGHQLTVSARGAAGEQLRARGARLTTDLADLAAGSDVVIVFVRDDGQVRDVMLGDDGNGRAGVLPSLRPGAVVVVHSTVHPDTVRDLQAKAAASGARFLDAPVTGGESGSRAGRLVTFLGGPAELVAELGPLFSAYCRLQFHVGDVGAGQVVKILNNLLSNLNTVAVLEVLKLSASQGLEQAATMKALYEGTGDSYILRDWQEHRSHQYDPDATGVKPQNRAIALKDLRIAKSLAERGGVTMPMLERAEQLMTGLVNDTR